MGNNITVRIYVVYHKSLPIPQGRCLCPIQVGTARSLIKIPGIIHDDIGDNISLKNDRYCELTAQFWAWKNDNSDSIGFFHYRRYLSLDRRNIVDKTHNRMKSVPAYQILIFPDDNALAMRGFTCDNIDQLMMEYDVIAPIAEEMHISVLDHFSQSKLHFREDIFRIKQIIQDHYPDFSSAADIYLNQSKHYFGNIFLMRKILFDDYCSWLFDILDKFDQQADFSKYHGKSLRVDGYLGERLFGIYFTWLKMKEDICWAELPRIHFSSLPGETDNFAKMRRIYYFLPPESRRRAIVKKLVRIIDD